VIFLIWKVSFPRWKVRFPRWKVGFPIWKVGFLKWQVGFPIWQVSALFHGVKTAAFLRGHERPQQPWLCFSLVTADRTVDFIAPTVEVLVDWYLVLASLLPTSVEPLLSEGQLLARIETMMELA
jgi:hypothetical protein